MPTFSLPSLLGLLAIVVLVELATFWAAVSLAEVSPLGWGRFLLTAIVASTAWMLLFAGLSWASGVAAAPLAPENQATALGFLTAGLAGLWLVPGLLYAPLLPASLRRSLLVSVYQVLLRGFVYAIILAALMLVLAGLQIYFGIDVRADLRSVPWGHVLTVALVPGWLVP